MEGSGRDLQGLSSC